MPRGRNSTKDLVDLHSVRERHHGPGFYGSRALYFLSPLPDILLDEQRGQIRAWDHVDQPGPG